MVKNIIHNSVFRIFTPIFYGVTMYILILLIFDRVQDLSENFLIIELILCLVTTYLLFEIIRMFIIQVEKRCSVNCTITNRILIQGGGSIALSLLITSLIISFYFSKLVGFNTFRNELIVFNTIFIITSILYNMVYFSFFYLNRTNVSLLEKEDILRKNVEIELDTYKNKINPNFLYDSLETLIGLSKKDVEKADQFILKLSDVYRNILSTKNTELVSINDELNIARTLLDIYNYKLGGNLSLSANIKEYTSNQLLSGVLVVVIEDIVNRNIISSIQPLSIKLDVKDNSLRIIHEISSKLNEESSKKIEIEHLKKAYNQFNKEFVIIDEGNFRIYQIPLLKLED